MDLGTAEFLALCFKPTVRAWREFFPSGECDKTPLDLLCVYQYGALLLIFEKLVTDHHWTLPNITNPQRIFQTFGPSNNLNRALCVSKPKCRYSRNKYYLLVSVTNHLETSDDDNMCGEYF